MYGDPMDNLPEVRELCLHCTYADCVGRDGCTERQKLVRELRKKLYGDRVKTHVDLAAKYTIGGETRTGYEWVAKTGRKKSTLYERIKDGCSFEEALLIKRKRAKVVRGFLYTINGETKTGGEWERALGLRKGYITQTARRKKIKRIDVLRAVFAEQESAKCDIKEL